MNYNVSSGHAKNFLQAAGNRHFKEKAPKDPKAVADLGRVSSLVCKHITSVMLLAGSLQEAAAMMEALPESFKSKKWAPGRYARELVNAALKYNCIKASAKTGLPRPRSITLKLNEALEKIKPRLIIAGGDEGSVVHLFDSAIIEYALFHLQAFEDRSIKHAGMDGKCVRMRKMMQRFDYAASMDFGAFDGSIDAETRDIIENKLVSGLSEFYLKASPLKEAAVTDRNKAEFSGYHGQYHVQTRNMIRESGDRGTSVLNYVTNFTLFVYGLWCEKVHQLRQPVDGKVMNLGDAKNKADKYVSEWLANPETREADIVGEGDDGAQFFSKKYVEEAAAASAWQPLVAGGTVPTGKVFGERWVQYYRDVGFSIEPQGPKGEVPASLAIRPRAERVEFISTIWVESGIRVYCLPKPVKTVTGSIISFAVASDIRTAA